MTISEAQLKQRREAGRKGGKAKKGTRSFHVIERELLFQRVQDKISERTMKLIDSQTILAMGAIKVFRIDTYYEGKKKIRKKPKLVTNDDELISCLDHEFGDGESPNTETSYYFVVTKDANTKAIDSLLDRRFGKPKQTVELTNPVEVDDVEKEAANKAIAALMRGIKKSK